ncbi:hypothetical protein GLAREA_08413 [Glarea lozoyensis ATCC 20868]|uniref:Uncharacterized protein n=1 Tax=Glarea lozoyensis (strain ATCC 20868 / MF5171) TaxID=1116229 RepID=S3CXJ7_GLAL2|nr:uncharacterized protein GLAREA_08413 [Glarea lozoyensis ATCC 20868]EPE24561.1 hypothetical protein GLAREA_08413 [Glarea lozoyensis ATCC 20868]
MSQYRGRSPNRLEQWNVGQAAAQLSFHPSIWDPIILFQRPGFDGGPRDAGFEIIKFLRRLATKRDYKIMTKRVKNITWRWALDGFTLEEQRKLPENLCAVDLTPDGYKPRSPRGAKAPSLEKSLMDIYEGKSRRFVDMRMYGKHYVKPHQWRYVLNFDNRTLTISAPLNIEDNVSLVFPFAYLVEDGKNYMKQTQTYLSGHPTSGEAKVLKALQSRKILEIKISREESLDRRPRSRQISTPPANTHESANTQVQVTPSPETRFDENITPPAEVHHVGIVTPPTTDERASVVYMQPAKSAPQSQMDWQAKRSQIKRIMGDEVYEIFMANLPASRPR